MLQLGFGNDAAIVIVINVQLVVVHPPKGGNDGEQEEIVLFHRVLVSRHGALRPALKLRPRLAVLLFFGGGNDGQDEGGQHQRDEDGHGRHHHRRHIAHDIARLNDQEGDIYHDHGYKKYDGDGLELFQALRDPLDLCDKPVVLIVDLGERHRPARTEAHVFPKRGTIGGLGGIFYGLDRRLLALLLVGAIVVAARGQHRGIIFARPARIVREHRVRRAL